MKRFTFLFLSSLLLATFLNAQVTLIPFKDAWKFLDNGSAPSAAWNTLSFNDASWKAGGGALGYGLPGLVTTINFGPTTTGKFITTYFRKTISLTDPWLYNSFSATVNYDDGVVVYVNGTEVYRSNMPSGPVTAATLAPNTANTSKTFTISRTAFRPGTNIVAAEIHQNSATTPDMLFDLLLKASADGTPPKAAGSNRHNPATPTFKATTAVFRFSFTEKVKGVDASDFEVVPASGTPGGTVNALTPFGTDGTTYDVTVKNISGTGALKLNLKAGATGITDVAGNAIRSGFSAGQIYTVDRSAPLIQSINRQTPNDTLTNADTLVFRATFSEPVTGVDAADFVPVGPAGTVAGTVKLATSVGEGDRWDIRVVPSSGASRLRLDLKTSGTGITDIATNALSGGFTAGETYYLDHTVPYVKSITRLLPLSTDTLTVATVTYQVVFSEPVISVGNADFTATPATGTARGAIASEDVKPVGTDGTTWSVKVTAITGQGQLRLDVNTSKGITDPAGNACAAYTTGQTYLVDRQAPQVASINRYAPTTPSTNAASAVFIVTFSEPVTGVNTSDFTLTVKGSAKGKLTADAVTPAGTEGTTYHVRVAELKGTGDLRLNVKSSGTGIRDQMGYDLDKGFTSGQTYTLDVLQPTVISVTRHPLAKEVSNATSLTYRVTFSEAMSGVDGSAFFTTAAQGSVSGVVDPSSVIPVGTTGATFDVTVNSVKGNGSLRLDVKNGGTTITDVATNALRGGFAGGQTYTVDQAPPSATAITRQLPAGENTNATTLTFRTVFSEKVMGVDTSDFIVTTLSGPACNVQVPSSVTLVDSGTAYDVTVSGVATHSTLRLDLRNTETGITDAVGNALGAGFTGGQPYSVDPPPFVAAINRQLPAGEATKASAVTFRVNFSERVTGVDLSDFTLTRVSGSVKGSLAANALAAVGTDGKTFDVTVSSITGTGLLRLDVKALGTGIADNKGSSFSGGYAQGQVFNIDYVSPVVAGISRQRPAAPTTNGTTVTFRVTFNEKVQHVDLSDFILTTVSGSPGGKLAGLVPAGTDGKAYDVTVNALANIGSIRLDLKAGGTGIQDEVNNPLNTGYTKGETYTVEYTPPTVVSINRSAPTGQSTDKSAVTFRISFSEAVTGLDPADFTLTTLDGTPCGELDGDAITPGNALGSKYDVRVTSITENIKLRLDLDSIGHGITDLAGNPLSGGFTAGQSYTIKPSANYGFKATETLNTLTIAENTEHKPQSKLWKHDGRWWAVLTASGGTKIFRLDGTSWESVLTINGDEDFKADTWVVGDLTHILLFRESSSSSSYLFSVEYDTVQHTYRPWSQRPGRVSVSLGDDAEVATLVVDDRGRMWVAADGNGDVGIRWSDAPYTTWSSRIKLASGATADDICTLAKMPGQIGVLWSNQKSERFGFKTHNDDDDPSVWSEDENPGSQSAKNVGMGFSDDHLNIVSGSDGTLYCAVKTSYDTENYPKESVLIRRPDGTWDKLYKVTEYESGGTRGIMLVNEKVGKMRVVYTSIENGGDILYRESGLKDVAFGPAKKLLSGNYNHATSTHQTFTSEVVVMVTDLSSGTNKAKGLILSDDPLPTAPPATPAPVSEKPAEEADDLAADLTAYPNPFSRQVTVSFVLPQDDDYSLVLRDLGHTRTDLLKQGRADGGQRISLTIDRAGRANGLYLLQLHTSKGSKTLKLMLE
ncbi:hypothetical protein V9K67_19815 [Paraflavisolibacter sp. H34]|uniref:hypothetical protein n=1 Tax=Huijunlia imazamoxiresistens TaxID=3127457 RepID=UPI003016BCE2